MRILAHFAPSLSPGCRHLAQQRDHAQLLDQHRVERHLVEAVEDVARRARHARPLHRVDRDEDRVARRAFAHQRRHGRISRIAAVPVGLAVDLDRLEHGGQAGRGEQHVGRELAVAEHPAAPGAHVGRGDEQLDRAPRQALEIDRAGEDVAERVGSERVEIVGREQPRHHVHGDEGRRLVERPAAEQDVERAAPERAEPRRLRHALPEGGERRACSFGAAIGVAVGQHGGVHGAGRGAGDAVDLEPRLFQQPVEHAPGEGAVRAAALQGEVDGDIGGDFRRGRGRGVGHRIYSALLLPTSSAHIAFQQMSLPGLTGR